MTIEEHERQAESYLDAADHALNADTPSWLRLTTEERVSKAAMYGTLAIGHALLAVRVQE
jgi:hypothetical protein